MIPILFAPDATSFDSHGLGTLSDCLSCLASTVGNGAAELTLAYPITGVHYSEIQARSIVLVKSDPALQPQPYRIYASTKPIKGVVTYKARHLRYDLDGIPVSPFTATGAPDYAEQLRTHTVGACPYTFWTNIPGVVSTTVQAAPVETAENPGESEAPIVVPGELDETVYTDDTPPDPTTPIRQPETVTVTVPTSALSLLAGSDISWQGSCGGELVFDRYMVRLYAAAGADRGVVIRYGIDLVDLQQEYNISQVYTGILPYYRDTQSGAYVEGSVLLAPGDYGFRRILPVDLSEYFESAPSVADLEATGRVWMGVNGVGKPAINLRVKYADLGQDVRLYDTVTVRFVLLGVDAKAKVVKLTYDGLLERVDSIEVGDVRPNIADAIMDASRLDAGTLDISRLIKPRSIGSTKMATGSCTNRVLAEAAVHEGNILGHAVTYDKLELAVQQLFVDILAANAIYSGVIANDGSVSTSVLSVTGNMYLRNYELLTDGITVSFDDTRYSQAQLTCDVKNAAGTKIGTVEVPGWISASTHPQSRSLAVVGYKVPDA